METGLALLAGAAVYFLWPRLSLPMLGREEVWFCLGWLILLAAPAGLRLFRKPSPRSDIPQTFQAEACGYATFFLAVLFVALLLAGRALGNYKLWLGIVYLGGITLRLAGLALGLRAYLLSHTGRDIATALGAAAIAALACLLLIPWVRPDLVAVWPPPPGKFLSLLAAGLLWGGISGAVLLTLRFWGGRQRAAWLGYLAVGLGPGPALAVTCFGLIPLLITFVVLAGLALVSAIRAKTRAGLRTDAAYPITLYWLLRAMMLLWWGSGAALALAAAWWQPCLDSLIIHSVWLRALGLGGFLVVCVGILAEYSLPLLGRAGFVDAGRGRKPLGVIFSALALLASFTPLLLTDPPRNFAIPAEFSGRARSELLSRTVTLSPENPEISLKSPAWLSGLTHIFVVSYLEEGAQTPQGAAVAQVIALDDMDMPHIFNLRAGIDTAEVDLDKRDVAVRAKHGEGRYARTWIVYTPTGEAYSAHSFFAGLYFGHTINRLKSVRLRYLPQKPPGKKPPKLVVKRVFVY